MSKSINRAKNGVDNDGQRSRRKLGVVRAKAVESAARKAYWRCSNGHSWSAEAQEEAGRERA